MKPLVFISGPYTHPDPITNTRHAIVTGSQLYHRGHVVPFIPHLTMLWHLVTPQPVEYWYELDLHHLERCDAVLRLPGESTGADREVTHAHELGIPVFTPTEPRLDLTVIDDWARSWKPAEMFTIKRTDGDPVDGDACTWWTTTSLDDLGFVDESDHDEPTEYVVEYWQRLASRSHTVGEPTVDDEAHS